ncbi:RagB/SusD family nutrient uptake outer membrane protein [Pustulibacterium marinum]|nr:RagB/SusD family nutrient uptake outer membrane protein [Pustulibacterium marinum]
MKKRNLIYSIALASTLFVGCSEDFINPDERNTGVITSDEISDYSQVNPELILGVLDGVGSFTIEPMGVNGTDANQHNDFGQKGVDIWLDIVSGDMALSANSYGWYQNTANLVSTVDFTYGENYTIWAFYYRIINQANLVIGNYGGNDVIPEDPDERRIVGQAKAYRAYAYFYLTQIFQRSYDPSQEILPYYDGENDNQAKVPASQIYALIESDLLNAIDLMSDYSRTYKHQIDATVASGILAYTYAAMGDYTSAGQYADDVINAGYPLTSEAELAYPGTGSGFNNLDTASWIWGYDLTEDMGHQLVDWWGQIDLFTYSYAWAGDRKSIDNSLYASIDDNDIRKTQFSTDYYLMPVNKFYAPARSIAGQQAITTDLIFMRSDEFYLLSAECDAKTGNESSAKATMIELLTDRLGADAASDYITPLSGQSLIDAIYLQTKIELWGEGKSYLAMKRNEATVTRGTNHVFRAGESFNYNSDELSFQIPQSEINNNSLISTQN